MIWLIYLVGINVIGIGLMGVDKSLAGRRKRRIPESRFFIISLLGGALGTWIGMKLWRHKTKHKSFTFGIPVLFVINAVLVMLVLKFDWKIM